jgi:hypothetical protein
VTGTSGTDWSRLGQSREKLAVIAAAKLDRRGGEAPAAAAKRAEAYELAVENGRPNVVAEVGTEYGQHLYDAGEQGAALEVLHRSLDVYQQLGRRDEVRIVSGLISRIEAA